MPARIQARWKTLSISACERNLRLPRTLNLISNRIVSFEVVICVSPDFLADAFCKIQNLLSVCHYTALLSIMAILALKTSFFLVPVQKAPHIVS